MTNKGSFIPFTSDIITSYTINKESVNKIAKRLKCDRFWDIMRVWSKTNIVVISEYAAPNDFTTVLEIPTKTAIRNEYGVINRIERLFVHQDNFFMHQSKLQFPFESFMSINDLANHGKNMSNNEASS